MRNTDVQEIHPLVASPTPPTGDLACNTGMCPDWESNQQAFGLQASTQNAEPHQPGLKKYIFDHSEPLKSSQMEVYNYGYKEETTSRLVGGWIKIGRDISTVEVSAEEQVVPAP